MIFLCYRRYSWQFDSFWIAKSHIHNNGFCGFNSWQVEQEPVSLVHPWFTPFRLYIFRFLHQTTTNCLFPFCFLRCISFVSYIKPQLKEVVVFEQERCISFVSYIKPQHLWSVSLTLNVVYLSFPTSNHNIRQGKNTENAVVYLSFPTSNHNNRVIHCD